MYIGKQNDIYCARYRYGAVERYIGNVRQSYALAAGKLREGEKIYLARGEVVPEYVMPATLRPLNGQRHFLNIALPHDSRISFSRGKDGRSLYRIDSDGVFVPTVAGNATYRSGR